jgi:hypothetical protein
MKAAPLFALPVLLLSGITARSQATFAQDGAPPVTVISFKIGTDYYPMLDNKPPVVSADDPDFPRPPNETAAQQTRRRNKADRLDDLRSRGKLRTTLKVISDAQWINVEIRNNDARAIKAVDWDFAFPRYESGQLILRYDVSSKVEIKPGGKKKLKQPLPPGAQRCQIVTVSAEAERSEQEKKFEAVCGQGFHDPSQLKQETVTIKRIEYADGSVWQRQEK